MRDENTFVAVVLGQLPVCPYELALDGVELL